MIALKKVGMMGLDEILHQACVGAYLRETKLHDIPNSSDLGEVLLQQCDFSQHEVDNQCLKCGQPKRHHILTWKNVVLSNQQSTMSPAAEQEDLWQILFCFKPQFLLEVSRHDLEALRQLNESLQARPISSPRSLPPSIRRAIEAKNQWTKQCMKPHK